MKRPICALVAAGVALPLVSAQNTPPARPDEGRIVCTMEYAPVCAKHGGETRTFGNKCAAEAAGYEVVHSGECGGAEAK